MIGFPNVAHRENEMRPHIADQPLPRTQAHQTVQGVGRALCFFGQGVLSFDGMRICIELCRLRDELISRQVMFIHHYRSNDSFGQIIVVGLQPDHKLFHLTACPSASSEHQNLRGWLQRLGHWFEKTLGIRLLFTFGDIP